MELEARAEALVAQAEVSVSQAHDETAQPSAPPHALEIPRDDASHIAHLRAMEAHDRSAFVHAFPNRSTNMVCVCARARARARVWSSV